MNISHPSIDKTALTAILATVQDNISTGYETYKFYTDILAEVIAVAADLPAGAKFELILNDSNPDIEARTPYATTPHYMGASIKYTTTVEEVDTVHSYIWWIGYPNSDQYKHIVAHSTIKTFAPVTP